MTTVFRLINFGGLSFVWHNNHNILLNNHKNQYPGSTTSSYSNLKMIWNQSCLDNNLNILRLLCRGLNTTDLKWPARCFVRLRSSMVNMEKSNNIKKDRCLAKQVQNVAFHLKGADWIVLLSLLFTWKCLWNH